MPSTEKQNQQLNRTKTIFRTVRIFYFLAGVQLFDRDSARRTCGVCWKKSSIGSVVVEPFDHVFGVLIIK